MKQKNYKFISNINKEKYIRHDFKILFGWFFIKNLHLKVNLF
jgi:hypothetical protein